jgi:hypothetical protein
LGLPIGWATTKNYKKGVIILTLNDLKKFINEFSKFEQNFEVCFASDNEGNSIANFNGECSTAKTKDGKPIVILYPSHDQILDWEE